MDSEHMVERQSEDDDGLAIDPTHVLGLTALIVTFAALVAGGAAFGGTVGTTVFGSLLVAAPR